MLEVCGFDLKLMGYELDLSKWVGSKEVGCPNVLDLSRWAGLKQMGWT